MLSDTSVAGAFRSGLVGIVRGSFSVPRVLPRNHKLMGTWLIKGCLGTPPAASVPLSSPCDASEGGERTGNGVTGRIRIRDVISDPLPFVVL